MQGRKHAMPKVVLKNYFAKVFASSFLWEYPMAAFLEVPTSLRGGITKDRGDGNRYVITLARDLVVDLPKVSIIGCNPSSCILGWVGCHRP